MRQAAPRGPQAEALPGHPDRAHDIGSLIALARRLRGEAAVHLRGGNAASWAYLVAQLRLGTARPLAVLASGARAARRLAGDLRLFLGDGLLPPPGRAGRRVLFFPAWDTFPFARRSPSPGVVGDRLRTLFALARGEAEVVVTSPEALRQRLLPMGRLLSHARALREGEEVGREAFLEALVAGGYVRVPMVEGRGEFALRGGIVDLFAPWTENPLRVEFSGDAVDSLREFNPINQRTLKAHKAVLVPPAREVLLAREERERGARAIRELAREEGCEPAGMGAMLEGLEEEGHFPGMEGLLPLFVEPLESLFDHLPGEALWVLLEPSQVEAEEERLWEELLEERARAAERGLLSFEVERLWMSPAACRERRRGFASLRLDPLPLGGGEVLPFSAEALSPFRGRVSAFAEELSRWLQGGASVLLVVAHRTQANRVEGLLKDHDLGASLHPPDRPVDPSAFRLAIAEGEVSGSFRVPAERLAVLREGDIFFAEVGLGRRPPARAVPAFFRDLRLGDLVVHTDYGVGRFVGLRTLEWEGGEDEFLTVEYAGGDRLYVPMDNLHLVQRYVGGGEGGARLDRMGGSAWERAKRRVKEAVREVARGLVDLYARRQLTPGFAFPPDGGWEGELAEAFEFEETPDQAQAIREVLEDMERPRPMDRLVCGDVGYGKTEVAMRASFRAVMGGKQVAVVVPTTLLAHQHWHTFRRRFAPYPIRVEMLSRFRSRKEQREVLEGLEGGRVDVVIGTHRLLQRDVRFKELGLLVVDEEHRFGVAHKERLKEMRAGVDVLTLSATPIPRTLHLSMLGIRDLSLIGTPPPDRLAIRTYIARFNERTIREAIGRELDRGGQVFFVHNQVRSLPALARYLGRLVPQARLAIAHGQMPERELEGVMERFVRGEVDVLLCTTIVESGLDIPAVNTLLVNRADTLGLAQLYQLRGRVGRDRLQAHAYLLVPSASGLTEEARERLQALEEFSELSAGFRLATRDLEIRGAGNILGHQQWGHVAEVGLALYCQLMEEAVAELKGERPADQAETQVKLPPVGNLPRSYIPDANERLDLYRRAAAARSAQEAQEMAREVEDRYGRPPEPVRRLFQAAEVRAMARSLGLRRLEVQGQRALFEAAEGEYSVTPSFLAIPGIAFRDPHTFEVPLSGRWPEDYGTLVHTLREFAACARTKGPPGEAGPGGGS